jgi:hypothetical protein
MKCSSFGNKEEVRTTSMTIQGLASRLRCEVHDGSSKLRLLVYFPTFGWITIGPHEVSAIVVILRHLSTHLSLQTKLEQLNLSKIDLSTNI